MGFTTVVVISNDGLSDILKNPDEFVEGIHFKLNDGGTVPVGNHANPVEVIKSEHADYPQIVVAWMGMAYSVSPFDRNFLDLVDRNTKIADEIVTRLEMRAEHMRRIVDEALAEKEQE